MTDYIRNIGPTGQMLIRDTGTTVEFWINAFNSVTYHSALPWGYTVNGVTASRTANYTKGKGWLRLGVWTVTKAQTVTFRLGNTGLQGLPGPQTFSVAIPRGAKPSPPSIVTLTSITLTSMYATFSDGANNGSAIDARQIGYGTNMLAPAPEKFVSSDRSTLIELLEPGVTYFFWARTHNAFGWSNWGPRSQASTVAGVLVYYSEDGQRTYPKMAIPWVMHQGLWRKARPYVNRGRVWKPTK